MRKVKWSLENYHCDNCKDGIVQIKQEIKRGDIIHTLVSGCLDCKMEFGVNQVSKLNKYEGKDIHLT